MNNIDNFFNRNSSLFASAYFDYLFKVLKSIDTNSISNFIELLMKARDQESNIFFIGNGGSAATASHFANDLSIGTNSYTKPFKAISLTDNQAIITAIANDYGYEDVFVRQLKVLGKKNDLLIAISASGNSPSLIKAFEYAKSLGVYTIGITAFDGGKIKQMSDLSIHVPTKEKEYGPAEDAHMILDHLISAYLGRAISF
jgi:D-sedoheptulose 7-phosphate isomerase